MRVDSAGGGLGDPLTRPAEKVALEGSRTAQSAAVALIQRIRPDHTGLLILALVSDSSLPLLERYRDLMKQGAILVDESDPGEGLRALFYLEHSIQDGRTTEGGMRRVVSRRLQAPKSPSRRPTRRHFELFA